MAQELLLVSQRALPTRLLDSGFTFAHPEVSDALRTAFAETG
jgi:NAD dependent epimerase/dehydratase family enzyme